MLADRPEFREWLARHDAQGFAIEKHRAREHERPHPDHCDGCGGPIGDTPSQLKEHCLLCLAERDRKAAA